MTSWIITMVLLVATGIGGGIVTSGDQLQDQDQDKLRLQDRDPARDGSCKLTSLITFTQFNS